MLLREPTVKAVLTWLMEEVRADPRFARKSPAEILDYCAAVLQQVRQYVWEAMGRSHDGSGSAPGRAFGPDKRSRNTVVLLKYGCGPAPSAARRTVAKQ